MDIRQNILLVDGLAASYAGVVVISSTNWLQGLYQLPEALLVSMALVNLSYAVYSLTLSTIKREGKSCGKNRVLRVMAAEFKSTNRL
jgi:hypothetical protein